MQNIFTIYHASCSDGTAAAAVVLKKFPHAKQYPLAHSHSEDEIEDILKEAKKGDVAYIVDCYIGVHELLEHGLYVTVIDHHADAKEKLDKLSEENDNLTFIFDNEKSGATLVWSYLFKEEKAPELLKYIEDVDLWNWRYGDDSKFINTITEMYRNKPEEMLALFDANIQNQKRDGACISQYIDYKVQQYRAGQSPVHMHIGGHDVLAYNINFQVSATGNLLAEEHEQAVMLFSIKGNEVNCSFRSLDAHTPSANDLAKALGGGGHKNASGATISLEKFISLITQR